MIVETHISKVDRASFDGEGLCNILPGYVFFHRGRETMKGAEWEYLLIVTLRVNPNFVKLRRGELNLLSGNLRM